MHPDYVEGVARAGRWHMLRGPGEPAQFRQALDVMTASDVTWDPYTEHRGNRPFELLSYYRGFIRFGPTMVPYLPDRVLRQFGFVQRIPDDPRSIRRRPVSPDEMDRMWANFDQHIIDTGSCVVDPSDTVPGYIEWFRTVSHPYIYPANVPASSPEPVSGADVYF